MTRLRLENRHTGEILELWREVEGGQEILRLRGTLPPHSEGPPLHLHRLEDETGRVTAGTLSALVGGHLATVEVGESVRLPKGVPHRWWNAGDQPLAFEGQTRPVVDLDRYLQAAFEIMNAGPPNRPSVWYMAHLSHRHRRTQAILILPPVLQAVLFPVVVALGTILGRYRGSEWPGCPTRCTGAPLGSG